MVAVGRGRVDGPVSVLNVRRAGYVDRSAMGLVLGRQLAVAVEDPLHLVDDGGPARVRIAGEEIGVALPIVGGVNAPHRAIDAGAERGDGIAGEAAEQVERVGVD